MELLADLGPRALGGLVLVILPVGGYLVLNLIWKVPRLHVFTRVPILSRLAGLGGILLGLGVLYTDGQRPSFRFKEIFASGGAWDVSWQVFLREIGDPALYTYEGLWVALSAPENDPRLYLYALLLSGVIGLAIVAAIVLMRGLDVIIGVLGVALVILMSQALTIYLATLTAYALNTFNFWIILIALVVLQYYRHKDDKVSGH
ncbi:MAG: hypothetical protein HQ481_06860 [Alphaproteobacteria bacterium]|nr:hypothetical protein [Alphaproteobacteria bacterium]